MIVTKSGRLKAKYLPAIYFDSSVLIDYWIAEGLETDRPFGEILDECEAERLQIMRKILKSDARTEKVIEIRRKILFGESKVTAVISPISLLELMEWNAEAAFKDFATEASGAMGIQRKSKKEIGDYLKQLLELRSDEAERQKGKTRERTTGLEWIMSETWLNRSFAECHGLQGLLQADIVNFKLTIDKVWQEPSAYAYLQLGISDIIHILIAQHLGCQYIASFDSDFQRVSNIITEETGMTVLRSPEEILMLF
jgi:predicted nucleic acid-binding protein